MTRIIDFTVKRLYNVNRMEVREFEKYLKCGLGRCVEFLAGCADREPYRPAVVEICLNNPAFDTQCEGTRAVYAHRLASLFGDDGYFVSRIIDKLFTVLDDSGWDFAHLCDLTEQFALNGNATAENALREAYAKLYGGLIVRGDCEGYDGLRDNFERLCVIFVKRYGTPAYEKIIADLGNLFAVNARYGAEDFDWLIFCLNGDFGKGFDGFLKKQSLTSAAVKTFYESLITAQERSRAISESRAAGGEERGASPLPPIADRAVSERERTAEEISEIIRSYRPVDRQKLLDRLNALEIDPDEESGWHGAVMNILDCFDDKIKLPRETLEFIYENSLCSCCREDAVRAMGKRGWLTDEIKRECLYDSNADIVNYAKRFFKRK